MAVTDAAILSVKAMIQNGELRPGDRLPPERELSEKLGLSRSSLREAVKALEVIRVLDVRQGDGTYVTSLEPRLLLEAVTFIVDLHGDSSVLEILAVRRMLECAAVGLAVPRITAAQLVQLRELSQSVGSSTSVPELVAHDLDFHAVIVAAAGNSYLTGLLQSLSSHTVRARIWRGLTQAAAVERTLGEHRAIVDAIAAGDAALAQALTAAHIAGVEQWVRAAVSSEQSAPRESVT